MTRPLFIILLLAVLAVPSLALAERPATELSAEAQRECDQGRRAKERSVRLAHFEKSQKLAERAVALNDQLAAAHFALFCSLGEQIRIDGETLSATSLFGFRRVMRELDRTLEIEPDNLDALSSKGTFLVRLPVLLGGDATRGEQLLRYVIQREPRSVNARLSLAKAYAARGKRAEAMTLAADALKFAEADGHEDFIPEARATLAALGLNQADILTVRP
ncbi:MAG: tetratricopeptide repeat protein [Nitrospirota bacterium]